jgi:hypothetical protein
MLGAQARIQELEAEIARIRRAFPHTRGAASSQAADAPASASARKRTMSPEARQRIADAARRRWAKYRKAKGKES